MNFALVPLRVRALLHDDVPLEDAWAVPLSRGGAGRSVSRLADQPVPNPRGQLLRAALGFVTLPTLLVSLACSLFGLVGALLVLVVGASTGCTLVSSPSQGPILAPTWRPGDEWVYRSEGPQGKSISMWSVVRLETVDGTESYVVKSGETGEVYFRRADLAWTMDKVSGTIESQATPPDLRYVWPLEVGKRWDVTYTLNRPLDRTTAKRQRECAVLAREAVSVPAGTFETVKIGCRDKRSGAATYEAWYAPAVKQVVRWHGHWADGLEKRELIRFMLN
jgi:hypothetical protein